MRLIQPVLKDAALKSDIEAADPGDGVVVWWLGIVRVDYYDYDCYY